MARRLERPNRYGGTTDHGGEIELLHDLARLERDWDDSNCLTLAAELLEAHDQTGISLDDWKSAREFVEHRTGTSVLPNNV